MVQLWFPCDRDGSLGGVGLGHWNLFHTFVEPPLAQGLWVGQDAHAHIFGRIHQELLKYNQSQIVNLHCEREGWKQVVGAA